jgi:hypothetical protein
VRLLLTWATWPTPASASRTNCLIFGRTRYRPRPETRHTHALCAKKFPRLTGTRTFRGPAVSSRDSSAASIRRFSESRGSADSRRAGHASSTARLRP